MNKIILIIAVLLPFQWKIETIPEQNTVTLTASKTWTRNSRINLNSPSIQVPVLESRIIFMRAVTTHEETNQTFTRDLSMQKQKTMSDKT